MLSVMTVHTSLLNPEELLRNYGTAALWVAALIVFVECGLFFFLLPGDSLLFTVGMLVASGVIGAPLWLSIVILTVAAIAGNVAGYEIGRAVGPKLFDRPNSRLIKPAHIAKTHEFFERHGGGAIVLARFVPIVRTFVTVVAGVGRMRRGPFFTYCAIGGVLWVALVTIAGYLLGNIPFIKDNIEVLLVVVVIISVLPMLVEWLRHRRQGPSIDAA